MSMTHTIRYFDASADDVVIPQPNRARRHSVHGDRGWSKWVELVDPWTPVWCWADSYRGLRKLIREVEDGTYWADFAD